MKERDLGGRWEVNIKTNQLKLGLEGVDFIHVSGFWRATESCEQGNEPPD
jgi:hypothetical protein